MHSSLAFYDFNLQRRLTKRLPNAMRWIHYLRGNGPSNSFVFDREAKRPHVRTSGYFNPVF